MRSSFRPLPFAVLLSLALTVAGPAAAQDAGKPASPKATSGATPATPAKPAKPRTLPGSPMAQTLFAEPAYPLKDDGTYLDYMDRITAEFGRHCSRQEQFGWELAKGDQAHLDHIFQGTMAAFEKTGYLMGVVKPKAVTDPETVAYLADRDKRRLLLVWVPMDTSVLLMMCDTADKATDKATPRKP